MTGVATALLELELVPLMLVERLLTAVLEMGVLETGLLELNADEELRTTATGEELELAFADDTRLLDATMEELAALVDERTEELEDMDPCLIAKALRG